MTTQLTPNPSVEQDAQVSYLRTIRAHPWLIASIAIVALGAAVLWHKTRTASYEATAQVLVSPVSNGGPYVSLPVVTESSNFPSRTLQTATSVLKSPAAARLTAAGVSRSLTQKQVTEAISIQPLGESNIVSITGKASSPSRAAALANTYAHETLSLHARQLASEARAEISVLQARQASGTGGEGNVATQITALSSVAAGRDPNFSLLQDAPLPTATTGTSSKLIALLALLGGLIVGIGAAAAIEYLNRRVRDEDEVLSIYPLPVFTRLPVLPTNASTPTSFEMIPPRIREAFRTLQLQIPLDEETGRVVMFTSASPRDGKTACAIDFALVLAEAGLSVILLDVDLRKPEICERLGAGAHYPDFIHADASLEELLVDVRAAPGLRMLGVRPHADVSPLLDATSHRLPGLLREAREAADYVIVDTPPVGPVSDAVRVAMAVDDTIVLVVRVANTNREELRRTRELLDRMGLTPTGMLVVGDTEAHDVYGEYGTDNAPRPVGRSNGNGTATGRIVETTTATDAEERAEKDSGRRAGTDAEERAEKDSRRRAAAELKSRTPAA